jgi:hypothetical protein
VRRDESPEPPEGTGLGGADRARGLVEDRGRLFHRQAGDDPQLEYLLIAGEQQFEGTAQLGVVVCGRDRITGRLPVFDHLGHPGGDLVLVAQTGSAAVIVGADPAGYPERPAVESCCTRLVDLDAANGPHHSFAHRILHLTGLDPPGDVGPQVAIFDINAFQAGDLSGGSPLPGQDGSSATSCTSTSLCDQPNPVGHQIQWKYFVPQLDANPNDPGINFARRTQPTISPALFDLPAEAIAGCTDAADPVCNGTGDLISRDFARGNYDGLASGQAIAKTLGCHVISPPSINPTKDAVFNFGTPLLYYVLAEAQESRQTLGCVGSSLVAQTFLQALWDTPNAILHTDFHPDPSLVKVAPETSKFSFGDLLVDTGLAPRSS